MPSLIADQSSSHFAESSPIVFTTTGSVSFTTLPLASITRSTICASYTVPSFAMAEIYRATAMGVTSVVPCPNPARIVCVGFHWISLRRDTISFVHVCVCVYPSGMPISSLMMRRISGPLPSRPVPSWICIRRSAQELTASSLISIMRLSMHSRRRVQSRR